jgi:hypothetical protein
VQGFVDGLREQLEFVWDQNLDVVWRNFVHERFRDKDNKSNMRQRDLALVLGERGDWVKISELTEITPRLAKYYAVKTLKTVKRDLNILETMGLVVRKGKMIRAKREVIQSFLPLRRKPVAEP